LGDLEAYVPLGAYHPATDLLVLDGIPRTVGQADLLDERVAVIRIVYLVCDDVEQLVQRLRQRTVQYGRADDADKRLIRQRLAVYEQNTSPLLEYYPAELMAKIDALRPPAEVFDQILHVLIPLLERRRTLPADGL
jgi:adenylate kinase